MTLREKLIVLRDKAGISQMSLAHQLDVSRQAVSRWESGDKQNASVHHPPNERCQCTVESTGELIPRKRIRQNLNCRRR